MDFSQATLLFVVVAPGAVFTAFALLWLLGWVPSERVVSRITGLTFSACVLALALIVWTLGSTGAPAVTVTFGNWFVGARLPLPAGASGGPSFPAVPWLDGCAFRTDRAILGDLPSSRAWLSALLPAAAPVRVRILARIRRRVVRSAGGRMGDRGHHFGVADRILSAAAGPGGKRSSRLRGVSRLRHRIAVGRFRHAIIGRGQLHLPPAFPRLLEPKHPSSVCFCLLRLPGRRRRFRSRDGFRARWKAPRHPARSFMARSQFTPARISCSVFNPCWPSPGWPPLW